MNPSKLVFLIALLGCATAGTLQADEQQQEGLENLDAFYEQLAKGREPDLNVQSQLFDQEGTNFMLRGLTNSASLKFDPASFMTLSAQGGEGTYWNQNNLAQDGFVSVGGQIRIQSVNWFQGQVGYHSLGTGATLFQAQYGYRWKDSPFWATIGARRDLVQDSFLSLVGQDIGGQSLGAARSDKMFAEVGSNLGFLEISLAPYAGWVQSQSLPENHDVGAEAIVSLPVVRASSATLSLQYDLQVQHYEQDQSGFSPSSVEPLPGGYFSPQLFISQTPELAFKETGEHSELKCSAGPSFQYVKTDDSPVTHELGAEAEISWLWRITRGLSLQLDSQYLKIAEVYDRLGLNGALSYAF